MRIPQVHRVEDSKKHKTYPSPAPAAGEKETYKQRKEYETAQVTLKPSEYVDDLEMFEDDPKELHKFVVRTKFLIRNSLEYKALMKFLKEKGGMYHCGVHPNVKKYDGFQIEIHHPVTIEDIIYIVINKRLKRGEDMKQSSIAKEVMQLHYLGLIGLYPLCEVCHGYVHSEENDLFIPIDAMFGNLEAFFDIYSDYIPDSYKVKFRNWQEMTKGYNIIKEEIPDNLRRHLVYIEQGEMGDGISNKKLLDLILELNE